MISVNLIVKDIRHALQGFVAAGPQLMKHHVQMHGEREKA